MALGRGPSREHHHPALSSNPVKTASNRGSRARGYSAEHSSPAWVHRAPGFHTYHTQECRRKEKLPRSAVKLAAMPEWSACAGSDRQRRGRRGTCSPESRVSAALTPRRLLFHAAGWCAEGLAAAGAPQWPLLLSSGNRTLRYSAKPGPLIQSRWRLCDISEESHVQVQ
ncbi:hypothetical protein AAFF_G00074500 [Aldrovandia affinis]|uniref:Uncharacterized protein n=1 Tax=Aldrovandia affinis TaxID=143900 RepID=A0AAD7RYK3_9TELE|nr:hypothetical protein AAFF_G00074500 [Aldrovandia affinis]